MRDPLRHLNALRAFEAAARLRSISKAADELCVSHSVISQHVRNLEAWLGTPLFVRTGNRIELTVNCQKFLPQISNGLQVMRDACDVLVSRTATRQIVVKAEPALAARWLRKRLIEFAKVHPEIEIELAASSRVSNADQDEADLVIHFESRLTEGNGLISRLLPLNAFPACAPALLPIQKSFELTDLPMVHDNGRHIWHQWFLVHAPDNTKWKTGTVYSDLALSAAAAVDGEGAVLADKIMFERELSNGELVPLDDRTVQVVWYAMSSRRASDVNPSAQVFQSWLLRRGEQFFDSGDASL